ncbi:MAG: hypothetical protein VX464_02345 [Pseudomonadota bacterium]|nr:hypothetical protein [Pseudomonadota bacterium]
MPKGNKHVFKTALTAVPLAGVIALTATAASAIQIPVSMRLAQTPLQVAEATSNADERGELEATFNDWQRKVEDAGNDLQNYAEDASAEARDAAGDAWDEMQLAWEDVKNASEDNWDDAKAKFQDSVARMEAAWKELTKDK